MIIDRRSLLPLERSSSLLGLGGGAMAASTSGDASGCNTLELPLSFHNASSAPEGRRRLLLDDTRLTVTPIASPSVGGGGSAAAIEHLRGLASAECHTLPIPANDSQKVMVTTAADPDRHLILMVEARAGSNKGKFMAWAVLHDYRIILVCAICLFGAHNCVCFVSLRLLRRSGFLSTIWYHFSLEHRARPIRPFPVRRYQTRQGQNLPSPNDSRRCLRSLRRYR